MKIEGKVVQVLNEMEIVVNLGKVHGVEDGDEILVYRLGNEIIDPDTGENLGKLEYVIGHGTVLHAQEKMSTVISSDYELIEVEDGHTHSPIFGIRPKTKKEKKSLPFENPQIGNFVRKI